MRDERRVTDYGFVKPGKKTHRAASRALRSKKVSFTGLLEKGERYMPENKIQ